MTYSRHENQVAVPPTKLLMEALVAVVLCGTLVFSAQAQSPQQTSSGESWTTTTESSVANTNPSRMTQSHTKSGNRTVDTQRVEMLGVDGRYQPFSETETETVQADATTTRTVVRTYRWDGDGRRTLAQVTEEEARSTASGEGHAVRTTSNSDVNGKLQVVKREVTDTRETSPDARETKTKVYLADGNGGFAMALQTQELQKHGADDTVEVKKTTLVPDGNGNWKVGEVKEKTTVEKGKNRTTEERIARPDSEGRLSEFSRTIGEETENTAGERSSSVETYVRDIPGSSDDGTMHRSKRVTTVQKRDSSGEITEHQVEQPNPGNPSDGPKVTTKTKYVVRYATSGTQQTKTVQEPDGNGNFNVVSVETRKSDGVSPTEKSKATADKPQ